MLIKYDWEVNQIRLCMFQRSKYPIPLLLSFIFKHFFAYFLESFFLFDVRQSKEKDIIQ